MNRLKPMDQPHLFKEAGFTRRLMLSPLASSTLTPLFTPPHQADWALLGGAGLAILIIIVLLITIVFLLFVIRRQARQSSATPTRPPAENNEANYGVPRVQTAPTVESNRPRNNKSLEHMPTQPSDRVRETVDFESTPPAGTAAVSETIISSPDRLLNTNWQTAGLTDVGRKRKLNEDNLLLLETETPEMGPCGLYVVADGMGGHESGEVASQLTIDTIQAHFDQQPPAAAEAPFEKWLKAAILAANKAVIARQQNPSAPKKMGATLVVALVAGTKAHIANVGDSRAYRITGSSIQQISTDHSLVERLIEIGDITREEARNHKQRNVVYSTIGDKSKMSIGFYHIDLRPGDRLLLCSDGLSGMLTDEQIFNISCDQASPAQACETLVKAANAAGGEDNITVIIIERNKEK